jgi:hypothetical protein
MANRGQNVVFLSNLLDARERGDDLAEVFDVQLHVGCELDPETPSGGVLKSSLSRMPLSPKDAEQLEYVASDPSRLSCHSTQRPSGDDGGRSQVQSSLGGFLLENKTNRSDEPLGEKTLSFVSGGERVLPGLPSRGFGGPPVERGLVGPLPRSS